MATENGKVNPSEEDAAIESLFHPKDGGRIEAYGLRGVYVPPGMTVAEIFEGAVVLQKELDRMWYDVSIYDAQAMVVAVLKRIRSPGIAERKAP